MSRGDVLVVARTRAATRSRSRLAAEARSRGASDRRHHQPRGTPPSTDARVGGQLAASNSPTSSSTTAACRAMPRSRSTASTSGSRRRPPSSVRPSLNAIVAEAVRRAVERGIAPRGLHEQQHRRAATPLNARLLRRSRVTARVRRRQDGDTGLRRSAASSRASTARRGRTTQRLDVIRFIGARGMNTLRLRAQGRPARAPRLARAVRRRGLDAPRRARRRLRDAGVDFVYCLSPGLSIRYSERRDDAALRRQARVGASASGVTRFALLLDDIPARLQHEEDVAAFANLVEAQRARTGSPRAA